MLNVIKPEEAILSGIYYGLIDLSKYQVKGEMFSLPETQEYITFASLTGITDIREVNAKYEIVKKVKNSLFLVDYNIIDKYFKSFDIKVVLELFYKDAMQRLVQQKMSEAGKKNGDVLDDLGAIINEIKVMLTDLQKVETESLSLVDSYKKFLLQSRKDSLESGIEGLSGITSSFVALDMLTRGFRDEYVVVAGRPSMGKTALSLDMIIPAILAGKNVLFFSLEMGRDQIMGRIISKFDKMLTLGMTLYADDFEENFSKIENILDQIEKSNFEIEDFSDHKGPVTTATIESKYKEYEAKHGRLDIAVVDYVQLLKWTDRRLTDPNMVLTEISGEIKRFVKHTKATWIILSQLSRSLESRTDKTPLQSDLRGSGAIEQDADKILFPFRESVYLIQEIKDQLRKKPDSQELSDKLSSMIDSDLEFADIILSKNRNGPTGAVKVQFHKKTASYVTPGELDLMDLNFDDL